MGAVLIGAEFGFKSLRTTRFGHRTGYILYKLLDGNIHETEVRLVKLAGSVSNSLPFGDQNAQQSLW